MSEFVSNWQPIETAPQDGDPLIVARIVGVRIQWVNTAWRKASDPGTSWKMRGGYCQPTHWTPWRMGE